MKHLNRYDSYLSKEQIVKYNIYKYNDMYIVNIKDNMFLMLNAHKNMVVLVSLDYNKEILIKKSKYTLESYLENYPDKIKQIIDAEKENKNNYFISNIDAKDFYDYFYNLDIVDTYINSKDLGLL